MKIINNLLCGTAIIAMLSGAHAGVAAESKAPLPAPDKPAPVVSRSVAGSYLSGEFARAKGNMDDAVEYAQRVHRQQPDNSAVAVQLEGMLLLQGKVAEALVLAQDIKKIDSKGSDADPLKDPLADLLLTLDAVKRGEPGAATFDPKSTQLWVPLLKGWIDIAQGKLDKPLTVAGSTDAGRALPLMHYHLALINSNAGFKDAAAKDFKAAVPDPKNPSTRVMGQLLKFYDQNDSPKALASIVKTYRDAHPGDDADDITNIATPQDGIAELLYSMGGLMFAAGGLNDAAIYLQLALYIKPDFTEASMALGDCYAELQYFDRSNEAYAKIAEDNTSYAKAQLRVAINDERLGKEKEALALLDKLAALQPNYADALVAKGDLLRMHEHYAEAIDAYSEALKRIPELKAPHWSILFARGSSYERQDKWPEAERDLQKALTLSPDQPDVLNYLGYGWLEHGQNIAQARDMIAKAVKVRPNDPQIVDSMGWALYLQGEYVQASEYMEKAVELMPADPTVNDHLGDVYWRLGRKTEARFQWERSLTYTPEAKLAETIHKKLKDGLPPVATLADTAAPAATATP